MFDMSLRSGAVGSILPGCSMWVMPTYASWPRATWRHVSCHNALLHGCGSTAAACSTYCVELYGPVAVCEVQRLECAHNRLAWTCPLTVALNNCMQQYERAQHFALTGVSMAAGSRQGWAACCANLAGPCAVCCPGTCCTLQHPRGGQNLCLESIRRGKVRCKCHDSIGMGYYWMASLLQLSQHCCSGRD